MATLVRKIAKVVYFLLLLIAVGRAMGEPYSWLKYEVVLKVGRFIYGPGEIGAEAIDDTYFYINFTIAIFITTALYVMSMKLIRKIRRK